MFHAPNKANTATAARIGNLQHQKLESCRLRGAVSRFCNGFAAPRAVSSLRRRFSFCSECCGRAAPRACYVAAVTGHNGCFATADGVVIVASFAQQAWSNVFGPRDVYGILSGL